MYKQIMVPKSAVSLFQFPDPLINNIILELALRSIYLDAIYTGD